MLNLPAKAWWYTFCILGWFIKLIMSSSFFFFFFSILKRCDVLKYCALKKKMRFWKSFNLWRPLLMIALYHQIKTPISFWCRRRLNPKTFIQPSETLLIIMNSSTPFPFFTLHQGQRALYIYIFRKKKMLD